MTTHTNQNFRQNFLPPWKRKSRKTKKLRFGVWSVRHLTWLRATMPWGRRTCRESLSRGCRVKKVIIHWHVPRCRLSTGRKLLKRFMRPLKKPKHTQKRPIAMEQTRTFHSRQVFRDKWTLKVTVSGCSSSIHNHRSCLLKRCPEKQRLKNNVNKACRKHRTKLFKLHHGKLQSKLQSQFLSKHRRLAWSSRTKLTRLRLARQRLLLKILTSNNSPVKARHSKMTIPWVFARTKA